MVKVKKDERNYILPNFLAEAMSRVTPQVQYESSMWSMGLMMIGLVVTAVYMAIYTQFPLWYKIFLSINMLAGLVFFWSFLVTTFQAYRSFMEAKIFQESMKGGNENAEEDKNG